MENSLAGEQEIISFAKSSMISCEAKLDGQNPVHQTIDALDRSKHGRTGKTGRIGNTWKMSHEAIKGPEGSRAHPSLTASIPSLRQALAPLSSKLPSSVQGVVKRT